MVNVRLPLYHVEGDMSSTITPHEQHLINRCYVDLKSALDGLASVCHKDRALLSVQHELYHIEDILHQYIGPTGKEGK